MLPYTSRRRGTAVFCLLALLSACGDSTEGVTTPSDTQTSAALSVVSGNDQSGITGAALSTALSVKALTASGGPAVGAEVLFAVTSGAATVSPATANTDANGTAPMRFVARAVEAMAIVASAPVAETRCASSFLSRAGKPAARRARVGVGEF